MDAVEVLTTRFSAVKIGEPGPPDDVIAAALEAGARAPDHGMLRPWKFIVVKGSALDRLGDAFARALEIRQPGTSAEELERAKQKVFRAPVNIVVAATVDPDHPKIPEIEQVVSAAAAAQNITLSLRADGFGCRWRTGVAAYDATVKEALGLKAHDHIVGFLYVGTALSVTPEHTGADHRRFTEVWTSEA
ncbi:MAG: nitroreductase [Rhodospirillales bacterium]|jgi:nitroreductase|nr:nitroreductase [Rhodospirillales bacterium]